MDTEACEAIRTLLLDQTMRINVDVAELEAARSLLDSGDFPDPSVSGLFLAAEQGRRLQIPPTL